MLIKPDERAPLSYLLSCRERGERVAHDCAIAQSRLVEHAPHQAFLLSQSRQELAHAWAFQSAVTWIIGSRSLSEHPACAILTQYRQQLRAALARREFLESIMGEQVILECLGEVVLRQVERGLLKREAPFHRLRRGLLHQEAAHQGFGLRVVQRAIDQDQIDGERLNEWAAPYLALSHALLLAVSDVMAAIDEDPLAYVMEFYRHLPPWITACSDQRHVSHNTSAGIASTAFEPLTATPS